MAINNACIPITFENNNDIIVYAFEKFISYARENQYIFLAQSIWWIASIIGLQQGLIIHIDNLKNQSHVTPAAVPKAASVVQTDCDQRGQDNIHPDRVSQVTCKWEISATSRDLTEDRRVDNILDHTEQFLEDTSRARNQWQRNQVNPLPQTKTQLKMAQKVKRLQEARNKAERDRQLRLPAICAEVIRTLSEE